jgi:hypothetical protein
MSRPPNEGPARHSAEALNVQLVPRSVLGSEELKWREQAKALIQLFKSIITLGHLDEKPANRALPRSLISERALGGFENSAFRE